MTTKNHLGYLPSLVGRIMLMLACLIVVDTSGAAGKGARALIDDGERLNLTPEQLTGIQEIVSRTRKVFSQVSRAERGKPGLSAKLDGIRKKSQDEALALLTPTQRQLWTKQDSPSVKQSAPKLSAAELKNPPRQDASSIPVLQSGDDLKLKSGNNLLKINFKGVVRDLFIELPTDMKKGKRFPIVFGFHGDGGPKEAYNRRLSAYVTKYQIISISILGTPMQRGEGKSSWDHHKGSDVDVDDIGFVQYLVDYLNETGRADLKRIYATGGSSGGLFCYRLAKETKLFAAIGPTKCGMIKGHHEPDSNTAHLSIMQVIGNEDKSFNGSSKRLTMYSAVQRIEIWRKFLKCDPKPSTNTKIKDMTIKTYVNDNELEVVYCMLHDVGHSIPRSIVPTMDGLILDFFMNHPKH